MSDMPYWPEPVAPIDQRHRLYLDYCAASSPAGMTGFFSQIARLELGNQPKARCSSRVSRSRCAVTNASITLIASASSLTRT